MAESSQPDITRLIGEYFDKCPGGFLKPRQLDRLADLRQALTAERLTPDTAGNLYLLATDTYGDPGPQTRFKTMLRERHNREILTSSLRGLLYGQGEVEGRLNERIAEDSTQRIKGVREAIMVKGPSRHLPRTLGSVVPGRRRTPQERPKKGESYLFPAPWGRPTNRKSHARPDGSSDQRPAQEHPASGRLPRPATPPRWLPRPAVENAGFYVVAGRTPLAAGPPLSNTRVTPRSDASAAISRSLRSGTPQTTRRPRALLSSRCSLCIT